MIEQNHLILPGSRVLVAVSGGPDSLCLLHVLSQLAQELGFSVIAAHLNHGIRREASAEARYVRKISASLAIPCIIGRADVPAWQKKQRLSMQEAARKARYLFLRRTAGRVGADTVALAHHRDDQVETVLINMLNGAGLDGLSGMPLKRRWKGLAIIRPLLTITRQKIEDYCREHRLVPVQDKSNLKLIYLRNRVRLQLIPFLEKEYNPCLREALFRQAILLTADRDYLDKRARSYLKICRFEHAKNRLKLPREIFVKLHPSLRRRLIRLILAAIGRREGRIGMRHVEAAVDFCLRGRAGKELNLPDRILAYMSQGYIVFTKDTGCPPKIGENVALHIPGDTVIGSAGDIIRAEIIDYREADSLPDGKWQACLDYHCVKFPLQIKSRWPGARIQPLGMGGKSRKLKDYFHDRAVPPRERDEVLLLVSDQRIFWVVGYGICDEARIRPGTKKVLKLTVIRGQIT